MPIACPTTALHCNVALLAMASAAALFLQRAPRRNIGLGIVFHVEEAEKQGGKLILGHTTQPPNNIFISADIQYSLSLRVP